MAKVFVTGVGFSRILEAKKEGNSLVLKQSENDAFDEESLAFYVHTDSTRLYTAVTEFRIIAINEETVKDLHVFKDPIVHACVTDKFILSVPLDSNVIQIFNLSDASVVCSTTF